MVDFGGEVKPVGIGEEEVGYDDGEGGLWLCLAVCWLKVFGDDLKGIVFGRGHVDGIVRPEPSGRGGGRSFWHVLHGCVGIGS